jgi:hypothetical protein
MEWFKVTGVRTMLATQLVLLLTLSGHALSSVVYHMRDNHRPLTYDPYTFRGNYLDAQAIQQDYVEPIFDTYLNMRSENLKGLYKPDDEKNNAYLRKLEALFSECPRDELERFKRDKGVIIAAQKEDIKMQVGVHLLQYQQPGRTYLNSAFSLAKSTLNRCEGDLVNSLAALSSGPTVNGVMKTPYPNVHRIYSEAARAYPFVMPVSWKEIAALQQKSVYDQESVYD